MTSEDIMEICADHPKQQQMFHLAKMLGEDIHPYYFNFFEDLKPTPFNHDGGDPETDINWDKYNFFIELDRPAGVPYPAISVTIDDEGLLDVCDMSAAIDDRLMGEEAENVAIWHRGLRSEDVMEIIEKHFEGR